MDPELFQFENLGTADGRMSGALSPYNMPTGTEIADSSIVDSSGNSFMPGSLLSAAGSGLGAFGSLLAGSESEEASQYNAQLALEQGQFEIKDLEEAEHDTLSTQRAMYAKAGVTMSGSPLDTAVRTASGYEMDKQIANYNAQSKANMLNYQGQVAKSQGQIKAGQQLLSGAASLAIVSALI